jgi:hypothetical protein
MILTVALREDDLAGVPKSYASYEVEVPETRAPLSNVQIVSFNDADTDVSML